MQCFLSNLPFSLVYYCSFCLCFFYLVAFSCLSADCWMFGLDCILLIFVKRSAQFQCIIRVDEHRKTFKL